MIGMRLVWASCAFFLLCLAYQPASACSCGFTRHWVAPESGTIPANSRGLVWVGFSWWDYEWEDPSVPEGFDGFRFRRPDHHSLRKVQDDFFVERLDGDEILRLPIAVTPLPGGDALIAVDEPLQPGAQYRFGAMQPIFDSHGGYTGDREAVEATVTVSETAFDLGDAPMQLVSGSPTTQTLQLAMGGSCSRDTVAAQQSIEVALPDHLEPFRDAVHYTTVVDGSQVWAPRNSMCQFPDPGSSWEGRGRDRIYAECGGDALLWDPDGLSPGSHRVYVEAEIPGTDLRWRSDEMELDLRCQVLHGGRRWGLVAVCGSLGLVIVIWGYCRARRRRSAGQ
jgi:hypothetical protein